MTAGTDAPADNTQPIRRHPRHTLTALCITEVTSWGVLYYAFPVALTSITTNTGWSRSAATAAFSAGLAVSALTGIPVGRRLDRYGPHRVMTAGSTLAVAATVAIAVAPDYPCFLAAWLIAGLAMAAVFYQAAFAALTRWYGPARVKALTALTLAAGLSSTIFAPATSLLLTHLDWRATYLVLAGVLALITIPLHALALSSPWPAVTPPANTPPAHRAPIAAIVRHPEFLLVCTALTLTAFGLYTATLTLIPLLTGRGFTTTLAATTLGLVGAGQLLGRIGYAPLAAHTSPTMRVVIIVAASAITIALLAAIPGPALLLILAAIFTGAVRGAGTLLQATVVAERWGTTHYGALSGWFAAPITAAAAVAPWGGTALAGIAGGYPPMFWLLTALAVTATATAAIAHRTRQRTTLPTLPEAP